MPAAPRQTLQSKYAASLAGWVSALLVAGGALGAWNVYVESARGVEQLQRARAQYAADAIAGFVGQSQLALQASVAKFAGAAEADAGDLRIELASLLRQHPQISELHWIGADGSEPLTLSRFLLDSGIGVRRWAEDPRVVAARRDGQASAAVYFRKGSEPHLPLAAAPAGEAAAGGAGPVLLADINLKHVADLIARLGSSTGSVTYVVDGDGALIAHPDIGLVLGRAAVRTLPQVARMLDPAAPAQVSFYQAPDLAGVAQVSAAARVPGLPWVVYAEQPLARALKPVWASIARTAVLVALGVGVAVLASIWLARRMVQPIRAIEAGARRLAEGRFDEPIIVDGNDELAALAKQFNQMAQRLDESYADLERRIVERTAELAAANESKSRFLATASHDLRQPMHALALFAGQLRDELGPDRATPAAVRLAQQVERSVQSLQALVESLLDLSRLDMGGVQAVPRALPLQPMLERLAQQLRPQADAKGLALSVAPTRAWTVSDPVLLERIVLNLLANALRYTELGRVLLGVRRRPQGLELQVLDTGIGIEPAQQQHVFDEFYRAPGSAGQGLGLGLAIVDRLTRLLGHELRLQSTPGRGTLVGLVLPEAAPQPIPAAASGESGNADLRGLKLLVIDDDQAVREALVGQLGAWGCEVLALAGDGDVAGQLHGAPPAAVLCDLRLAGGRSGVEIAAQLRARYGADLRLAFVTGETAPQALAAARASGHTVVAKPLAPARLRALVQHLVQG